MLGSGVRKADGWLSFVADYTKYLLSLKINVINKVLLCKEELMSEYLAKMKMIPPFTAINDKVIADSVEI